MIGKSVEELITAGGLAGSKAPYPLPCSLGTRGNQLQLRMKIEQKYPEPNHTVFYI
jgi:hypothetical protein